MNQNVNEEMIDKQIKSTLRNIEHNELESRFRGYGHDAGAAGCATLDRMTLEMKRAMLSELLEAAKHIGFAYEILLKAEEAGTVSGTDSK